MFKTIRIFFLILTVLSLFSCGNDDRIFQLKTVKLIGYERRESLPEQNLYIKIFKDDIPTSIAQTEIYPGSLPLPAVFKVYPSPEMNLYAELYHMELWGDVTGYIGNCSVDMAHYKIVFPIDMEVKGERVEISMQGSWR